MARMAATLSSVRAEGVDEQRDPGVGGGDEQHVVQPRRDPVRVEDGLGAVRRPVGGHDPRCGVHRTPQRVPVGSELREGLLAGDVLLALGEHVVERPLRVLWEALEHRDVQQGSTEQRHRSYPIRVPGQEHLFRGGPVGDADEVGLRVVKIGEHLVDVVREQGRGVEARVAVDAVHARLDGRPERCRVRQIGEVWTGHGRRPCAPLFDEDQVPVGVRGEERAHPADGVHRRVARAAREPDDGIGSPLGTRRREHDDPDRQLAVAVVVAILDRSSGTISVPQRAATPSTVHASSASPAVELPPPQPGRNPTRPRTASARAHAAKFAVTPGPPRRFPCCASSPSGRPGRGSCRCR